MTDVCLSGTAVALIGTLLTALTAAIGVLYTDARSTLAYERARTAALQALLNQQIPISGRLAGVQERLVDEVGGLARGMTTLRQEGMGR